MSDNTSTISLILSIILCLVVAVIFNKVFISKTECPEQCPAGPAGPRGAKGDQGEVGPEGPRGLKGDQGDKGDAGPRGLKGDKGEQGIQGEKGPQGIAGQKGEQGPQGLLGPVGIQGIPGKDGSIVITDSSGNPLGNYYDKTSVDNLLKPLATQASVDTSYVRKTEVYDKTTSDNRFTLKTSVPDLSAYAKTADVSSTYALKTSLPDLTPYAKTTDVSATYALKTALPDLTPYARTADVNKLLEAKAPLNNPTFSGTVGGITKAMIGLGNVDNTTDLLKPLSTAITTALGLKANLESPVFTGTVGGITKAMIGLGNVDNTTDLLKPVSTATTTALGLKANLANPVFTGTVGGITKAMVGLGDVDNTSDLLKPLSTAVKTSFASHNDALVLKAPIANPVFTGTVGGITKAMIGLGNVDNTTDLLKPLSTATTTKFNDYTTTTAMNTKFNDYALTTAMNTKFNDYTTTTAMNTKFNDYALTTAMNTKFNDYALTTEMNTKLDNYFDKNTIRNMLNATVPIGTIIAYSDDNVPLGFILCNGAEYDRAGAYSKLFNVIGITYGSTSIKKFNVPNIKSRTILGVDSTKALASTGGAETVTVNSTGTLTIDNMPSHKHTAMANNAGAHTHSGSANSAGGHSHSSSLQTGKFYEGTSASSYPGYAPSSGAPASLSTNLTGDHTHGLTIASDGTHSHTVTVDPTGGGTAFSAAANNVSVIQPYITLNYIIKFDDPSNIAAVTRVNVAINNENFDGEIANETVLNQFTTSTDPSFKDLSSATDYDFVPLHFKKTDGAGNAMTTTTYTILKVASMDSNGLGATAASAESSYKKFMMVKTFKNINDKLRQISHPCYIEKNNNTINVRDEVNDWMWTPWVNVSLNQTRYDVNESVSGITEIKPAPASITTLKSAANMDEFQHLVNNAIATMNSNSTITAFKIEGMTTAWGYKPTVYYSGTPSESSKVPYKTGSKRIYTKTDVNTQTAAIQAQRIALLEAKAAAVKESYTNKISEFFGVF